MSCKSLKFNGVELADFTDTQLKQLCLKHQIITTNEAYSMNKQQLLVEIKGYLTHKMNKYKSRRLSQPNLVNQVKTVGGPPQSNVGYNRDRRMSQPITKGEVKVAKEHHAARQQIEQGQNEIRTMKENPNMKQFDQLGMYPAVPRLVAIGDLHGDLKVTLQTLRLAKVIPRHIYPNNVHEIS